MRNVIMTLGVFSTALLVPVQPAAAQSGGGSIAQCAQQARNYANSVATPNTEAWKEEFIYYIEYFCSAYTGGGGGSAGGADLQDLCRQYVECNVSYPTRLPSN